MRPRIARVGPHTVRRVLRKLFAQAGELAGSEVVLPMCDDGTKSTGFGFVEYKTADGAATAQEATQGHQLDKSHVLTVTLLSEFDRYVSVNDAYKEPAKEELARMVGLGAFSAADPHTGGQLLRLVAG